MLLADVGWEHLALFRRATPSRAITAPPLLAILHQQTAVRPIPASAIEAADSWITEQMSDATFFEYVTAEEQVNSVEEEAELAEDVEDTVKSLRARVRQLEAAQGAARATVPPPPVRGARQTRPVLDTPPEGNPALTEEDWQRLRAAAGAPPARLAGHERAPRTVAADSGLAEEELEVSELQPPATSDSALLRLLSTQAALLEKLTATKAVDPITAALSSGSGGDSVPGSSSGTKGIAAREAFLRVFEHHQEFAEGVAKRAQQELGLSTQEPGMMRMYTERKIPVKELKTVQIFAFFLAYQWEELGEAWAARGLVMAEQIAIDNGRTQLGFLLSGLPDIDQAHLASRRTDIRPYGRLCAPPWMAAQVAFLRDVDYLENRTKLGRNQSQHEAGADKTEESEDRPRPKRPPRKPRTFQDKPTDKPEK